MKFKILITLLLLNLLAFSQEDVSKLIFYAEKTTNNLQKAKLYLQISEKLEKDTLKCFNYIENGISIARNIKNDSLIANFYYNKAHSYDKNGEYKKAIPFYKKSISFAEKTNDIKILEKSHINIGATLYYYGEQDNALKNYQNSLKYALQLNDNKNIARNYNNIALIQKAKGQYVEAIKNFHKSLDINLKEGNKKSIANTYVNIGSIYWEQKNYSDAELCYKKSAKIYKVLGAKKGVADTYINLGLIFKAKKDTLEALKYYKKAVTEYQKGGYKLELAAAFINIAVIYDEKKEFKKAEKYYHKSLKISNEFSYKKVILSNLLNLSMIYASQKRHTKSINYAKKALFIAIEIKDLKSIYNAYKTLAINYSHKGQFNLAYNNILKYTEIKDTLFNLEKNKQLNEIRTKYETEKKEAEILLFKEKDKISKLKIEKDSQIIQRTSIILIITVLSLILFFILFIQKRKSYLALVERNVQLTKQDIEKEKIYQKYKKQEKISDKSEKKELIEDKNIKNIEKNNISGDKYKKSVLSDIQKQELLQNIILLMEEEKYFLNPHFTIDKFSKKMNTNRGYISQIINEKFGLNFNNFVNEYRVKEARKFLIDPKYDNYSLSGIASIAGFNTRATFNNAFKRFTGVTPSFFKQNSRKTI